MSRDLNLPVRRAQFKTAAFLTFLADNGCEIGKPTNPYEVVRYKAYHLGSKRPVTHVVYAKENGLLTWTGATQGHYQTFLWGGQLVGVQPPFRSQFEGPQAKTDEQLLPKKGRSSREPTRTALLERDGPDCWFCGTEMGDDCTIEHLIPKSKGGRNSKANYVLAHAHCNQQAGDKPLTDKIAMREQMRAGNAKEAAIAAMVR